MLSFDWRDLETAPGTYAPEPNYLRIANAYYPAAKIPVHLMIRPIHTNQNVVPKDLQGRAFDDPTMIRRFNRLLDFVLAEVPDLELASLSIGSEIDILLGRDARAWRAYETFCVATAAHARRGRPGLQVSFEVTMPAFTGAAAKHLAALNRHADVIGVSYYPLADDFTVEEPTAVHAAFAKLVSRSGRKPIVFYQLGYPSSTQCGSSEAKQAQFIEATFEAWDTHAERIRMIAFTWLSEVSPATVEFYTGYYGLDAPGFRAFLGTIGLRTHAGSGTDKPAFRALKKAAAARGW